MTLTTRFAPSPTGPLHLGHAFSALLAWDMAERAGGQFLLRIEDIDQSRARTHWEEQIYDDLRWLGLSWPEPVMRQSDRQSAYDTALDHLWNLGLLYPCTCNRKDIAAAASAPQEGAPLLGPDGIVYPGTCRPLSDLDMSKRSERPRGIPLRLNMAAATKQAAASLSGGVACHFVEDGHGLCQETGHITRTTDQMVQTIGDVVLSRRDMGTSYHLSVVVDDADQNITHVVRGADLFDATPIHVLLQLLLGLPTPVYHHHDLIRDDAGKRLAKRDDARAIAKYRQDGLSPADIRKIVGL
ncbi:tRNA glutamyl-Q(34) synthetase GluQRS [Aliisedimentitalea scapharcae]|uniref:tRNA glutamyl-Q(34) synthetase GluQRS n=1 Tax=Aliisedimentitalea scapharcae TaxID=1524259 RepID=A0ABZ2XMC7_9RHOB